MHRGSKSNNDNNNNNNPIYKAPKALASEALIFNQYIAIIVSETVQDAATYQYYGRRIGNRTEAFEWCHFE